MKKNYIDYILAYLIVVFSGLNFFMNQNWTRIAFLSFIIILFIRRKQKIDYTLYILISINLLIIIIQSYLFGGNLFTTITFIASSVLTPYLCLKILGLNYIRYVINIISVYAIISLLFWSTTIIFPSFHDSLKYVATDLRTDPLNEFDPTAGNPKQFILYTYEPKQQDFPILRNPGPFHEPGAFAVFLIFSLCFNLIVKDNGYKKKNVILILALITTFSTAGYLALLSFYIYFGFFSKINIGFKIILLFPAAILIGYLFFYLNFMENKISEEYENGTNVASNISVSGRFMGATFAIKTLEKYPLTGQGIFKQMRPGVVSYYGFMDYASRIGIPAILLFFTFFYRGIKAICKFYSYDTRISVFIFIAFLNVLFAQAHIANALFQMLFMSSFVFPNFQKQPEIYKH
jgi:hypothetical protein